MAAAKHKDSAPPDGVRLIAQHKRARFDYSVEETLEAGIELLGSEVKSLRQGGANLTDSYAIPRGTELYLLNARIGPYGHASAFTHEPTRSRRLLLHRSEIDRWSAKVRERGYSIIPLMLYFKRGIAKVQLGLCLGKTHEDRRAEIKERETRREIERALRRR
ncbi:MAG TPA: SsrA-binding protein SmpB [Myxococcaceae bacterium]|nr:SsrA-binding protein SmpB [Myxococcaceae bacterium]